jgi:hypothetical protein
MSMINRRTILKQDLVKKLYPDSISIRSALEQLRNEINLSPEIKQRLIDSGSTRKHYYNNRQLEIILEHFCINQEEFEQL